MERLLCNLEVLIVYGWVAERRMIMANSLTFWIINFSSYSNGGRFSDKALLQVQIPDFGGSLLTVKRESCLVWISDERLDPRPDLVPIIFCEISVVFSTFHLFLNVCTCKIQQLPPTLAPLPFPWPAPSCSASRDSAHKHVELLQHKVLVFPCRRVEHYPVLAEYPLHAACLPEASSKPLLIKAYDMTQLSSFVCFYHHSH